MRGELPRSTGGQGEREAAPEHRAPAELCDDLGGGMGRVKERLRREAIHVHTQLIPRRFSGTEATYNAGDEGSIRGSGRPLEKETATHSSILAWRIPWTEEPGRMQSTGSRKSRT